MSLRVELGTETRLPTMALCPRGAGSGLGLPGLPESLGVTRHSSADLEKQSHPQAPERWQQLTIQSIVSLFPKSAMGLTDPFPEVSAVWGSVW